MFGCHRLSLNVQTPKNALSKLKRVYSGDKFISLDGGGMHSMSAVSFYIAFVDCAWSSYGCVVKPVDSPLTWVKGSFTAYMELGRDPVRIVPLLRIVLLPVLRIVFPVLRER